MEVEDRAYRHQQRIVRRRLMETQSGAEVRRLHIVYFLNRKGFTEHPHLIRVHHLSSNGVRLRDIKRWLGELRGKDMAESFAWSYKRRYKTGYVWQDLLDDDLVTPISDNEFVLKGSEIFSTTNNTDFSCSERINPQSFDLQNHSSDTSIIISTTPSSKNKELSPNFGSETSTLTYESGPKHELDNINSDTLINQLEPNSSTLSTTFFSTKKNKKKNKRRARKVDDEKSISTTSGVSSSDNKPRFTMSIRNLITCGDVDTRDSPMVMSDKKNRAFLNMCSGRRSIEICEKEKLETKTHRTRQLQLTNSKNCDELKDSTKRKSQCQEEKAACVAYKPLYGPNCSQCGKQFKPEKMHSHMKSCRGKKALVLAKAENHAISAAAAQNALKISTASRNKGGSVSGYILSQ